MIDSNMPTDEIKREVADKLENNEEKYREVLKGQRLSRSPNQKTIGPDDQLFQEFTSVNFPKGGCKICTV